MITGNIVFVYPDGSNAFAGPKPTPEPIIPDPIGDCSNSVGGIDGKNFTDSLNWVENCKMFRD